jgi:glycosyltransferase involved in cell wall biosynthesis
MSSRTEGFPNGLGEAMAMSLPCVATNVDDTKVLTGETAKLVTPENPGALANALSAVLALSNEQRQAMGQRAAGRVRSEFSIDKTRERFNALYQQVMESKA